MVLAVESRFTQLKISGRLPTPKGVALEVISLTQKEEVSNNQIIRLISTDAALSLRVIKAANMLMGNVSRPVSTIADAVMVLGARALRQLVLGIALMLDYRRGPCKQFDYGHFWVHSLLTGIAANHLAKHSRMAAPDEIFMVGLLGNIGQLALATLYAEDYGVMLEQHAAKTWHALQMAESEKFGFDEMELSEAILADSHFPRVFQTLVREYLQPDVSKASQGSREWQLLHLLNTASLMTDVCMARQEERGKLVSKLRHQAVRVGIESDALVEIGDACTRDWLEWSALLGMGRVDIPPFADLLLLSDRVDDASVVAQQTDLNQSTYPLRVLLVEDDRIMSALLESKLAGAGHTVFTACNGEDALTMIAQHQPQLIISDWLMPGMDGISLCRRLREHSEYNSIYFIVMTAQEDAGKLVEAFEAGADDYLVKPINTKIFFARLRAGIRVVKLQEELASDREQLLHFSNNLKLANDRLQQLALTDVLTSLPNRRAAMERLEQEWALTGRTNRTLTCLMVDIDHFKVINDKLGHPVGDIALRHVAHTLRQSARAEDIVCRFGGEEFLVICPDTGAHEAYRCAERLRLNVENMVVSDASLTIKVTISIGVASKSASMQSPEDLLSQADQNLYAAKLAGRNRTIS